MATREQHLARVYRDAIAAGLGPEGAKVAVAIATTEHGYEGGVGDTDRSALGSAGTFQLYFGGGQGNNFAAQHRMGEREARDYLKANPHAANQWALTGYLGQKIKAGLARGLRGPDLATFAQGTGGQGSESPERSGANYRAIWSTAQPAITSPRSGGVFGATTAEAAELDASEPTGGKPMPSSYGLENLPDSPAALAASPAPPVAPSSENKQRITEQLGAAQKRLSDAQKAQAAAEAAPLPDTTVMTRAAAQKATQAHADALKAANTEERAAQAEVKRLEKELGTEADKLGKPATPKNPWVGPDGVPYIFEDGKPVAHPELGTRPPAGTVVPKASRTYKVGGVDYTETAPDTGDFGPLPGGVTDPDAITPYQGASLGVAQQNAQSSSVSAAASMLHAQVAKGTLDFNQAKTIFDYVVAQQPPVEEGGKLWSAGGAPSDKTRNYLGLAPVPWRGIDAPGFFGRPELNQYVRGADAFGGGPMTPEEYHQRQGAGGFQPGAAPQPQAPAGAVAGPAPGGVAPAGPDPGLLDQRHGEQMGGGFQPQPAMATQANAPGLLAQRQGEQGAGVAAAAPSFGMPTGGGADVGLRHQALMGQLEQTRQMLLAKGIDPQIAEQAARQYLGVGASMGQTPY